MTFGAKLQQVRKAAGLSQEQLADLMELSRQAISKWETDQAVPDIEKVTQLCEIFKLSADEFLGTGADAERERRGGNLEVCVRMNLRRRCFTAGWLTALAGVMFLISEYYSLFSCGPPRFGWTMRRAWGSVISMTQCNMPL